MAGAGAERTPETLVVLDVARTLHTRGVEIAFELAEQLLVALAHDVYEHVQASTVGHPHHRVPMTMIGGGAEQGVQERYDRFCPFQAKALLPDVLGLQETFERFSSVEFGQDMTVFVWLEVGRHTLDVLLDPTLLRRLHNVHVLDAHGSAICVPQEREDVAEAHLPSPGQSLGQEFSVESHTVRP